MCRRNEGGRSHPERACSIPSYELLLRGARAMGGREPGCEGVPVSVPIGHARVCMSLCICLHMSLLPCVYALVYLCLSLFLKTSMASPVRCSSLLVPV